MKPLRLTINLDGKAEALKGVTSGVLILLAELTPAQRRENAGLICGIKINLRNLYRGLEAHG